MLEVCQKEKEALIWGGEGPHPIDGASDPGQSVNQSGLGRRVQKAPRRPLPLLEKLPCRPPGMEGRALMADVVYVTPERPSSRNRV